MLMIWSVRVSNLSQIWLKFKQDVDDLIYESIKSEQDLSNIWVKSESDVDDVICESIKYSVSNHVTVHH